MTHPSQHLPQEVLIDYVSGRAPEAVSLAVACHATLCGRCQSCINALEAVAGAALETAPGFPLRAGVLEEALAKLDVDRPADEPRTPAVTNAAAALRLPRPLLRYLDRGGGLRWKRRLPGVHVSKLGLGPGAEAHTTARLVRFKAGLTIPRHSHSGREYTVVFTGAFDDAGVRYERGDVCVRNAGDRHVPRVLPGEDCVVLAVNQAPLSWVGRLMRFLLPTAVSARAR